MITANTQQLHADFQALGFEIELTQDGSPTLRLQNHGESMHHSGGAATETQYIYGDVLEKAHQILRASCKTCVVGLGLGYIEISWAFSLLKENLQPSEQISFHSFELVSGLIENFKTWIYTDGAHPVYDDIVFRLNAQFFLKDSPKILLREVKKTLQLALQSGSRFYGDFSRLELHHQALYNIICYDAFSQKTNSSLWQAEFLESFLKTGAAPDCVITTYACTGVLRKTLLEKNFSFFKRPGFCGKRDSTLAVRGIFKLKDFQPTFQTSSCNQ